MNGSCATGTGRGVISVTTGVLTTALLARSGYVVYDRCAQQNSSRIRGPDPALRYMV